MASPRLRIKREAFDALPESSQKALKAEIRKLERAFDQNPLLSYSPYSKQATFHGAPTKVRAFIAGNRAGKTTCGVADDVIQAIDKEWVPKHLLPYKKWDPPFKCRIITPDLGQTMEVVLEKLRDLVPPSQLKGGRFDKAFEGKNRILWFKNRSMFDFMSYDQDLDKFGGVSRHRIHYDEEPPEDIRKASRKRLIDYGGDEIFTFTPEVGISWTYDAIDQRHEDSQITVVHAGILDNPHLSPDDIEFCLQDLTAEERKIALMGEYAAIRGVFYPEFAVKHVVSPPSNKHLEGQTIVCGIDPGYNTTAVIWIAFDSDNSALVFDELYTHKEVADQIAPKIRDRNAFWGIEPQYVIDPSARNMATINADQVEASFARVGIFCQHGQNSRPAGITEVKRRLQNDRLLISKECAGLRREFPRYRRDPKGVDEWQAVKVDDHGLDAMRYALMARAWNTPETRSHEERLSDWTYEGPYRPRAQPVPPLGAFQ